MKRLIQLTLMSIAMCLPLMAQADDKKYEVNGIWYTVDLVTFTAEVTSGDEKYSGEVSIPYHRGSVPLCSRVE